MMKNILALLVVTIVERHPMKFRFCLSLPRIILLCLPLLLVSQIASADVQEDARAVVERLRSEGMSRTMPDEMASLEATFESAEKLAKEKSPTLAERYYRLTIQKARVLESIQRETASRPVLANTSTATKHPPQKNDQPQPVATTPKPVSENPPAVQTAKQDEEPEFFSDDLVSEKLVGSPDIYTVDKGESLRIVAAKLGVTRQHLTKLNNLDAKGTLKTGQKLKYNNRKIIPQKMKEGIVINIPDRTLYFFRDGKLTTSLPVALGVAVKNKKYDWTTPIGKFKIIAKQKDPTWYVPPSIQSEMEEQGKPVITSVPPGPNNPLGKYAMKTSLPGILIHSTIKPWSIYTFASHGCIRVFPTRMEEFFKEVKINTPGEIIYRPVKVAMTEEGRVFLEVHNDIYGKSGGLTEEAKRLLDKNNLADRVDWKKVDLVIKQKTGIAEDVTL